MHVISVVGARPQFMKIAPIDKAMAVAGLQHTIVHTGQHYDERISKIFFADIGISMPEVELKVGSASHGKQTGLMLEKLETVFAEKKPDWVLVYGDTNSTLAAALAAVKIHIPVAHLEAGIRSYNRHMPEEHNRVLTDHAADLLLAPTEVAMQHIKHEGIAERSVLVGDVMTDLLLQTKQAIMGKTSFLLSHYQIQKHKYYVATIHRAENTDDPSRLAAIIDSLARVPYPVVLAAHPRIVAKAKEQGLLLAQGNIIVHEPLAYQDLILAALDSAGIITDSGGLQKEAFLLQVPCTTVRTETEWVETVESGWNQIVEPGEVMLQAVSRPVPAAVDWQPYGDGQAAKRVVSELQTASKSIA